MKCPVDNNELGISVVDEVDFFECQECHGLWCNKESFHKAKDHAEPDINWMDFDLWSDKDALQIEASSRKCPICEQVMMSVNYPHTNTRIDYCAKEHGMWLDKGEFETIITSLENEADSMDLPEYVRASVKEARDVLLGKEGFISEWKDFMTVLRLMQYRLLVDNPKFAKALADFQVRFRI